MWNSLSNFAQKAQVFVDQNLQPALNNLAPSDNRSSKAALFRHQFRLPDSQNPLYEITAELTLPPKATSSSKSLSDTPRKSHEQRNNWDRERGNHYVGRLHLSEKFLCFSTQNSSFSPTASNSLSTAFTGQTNGAGPAGNGFTLPLCAVRRVERLHSQSYMFALSITTWNGYPAPDEKNTKHTGKTAPPAPKLTIQLAGSRVQCEKFCDMLKKGLREGMREVDGMRKVVGECYSEYMLAAEAKRRTEKDAPSEKLVDDQNPEEQLKPPDAGLGMQFRYPGDPKKLRDKGKMRLWYEYLRGKYHLCWIREQIYANNLQKMVVMLLLSDNQIYLDWSELVYRTASVEKYGNSHLVPSIYECNSQSSTRIHWQNTRVNIPLLSTRLRRT